MSALIVSKYPRGAGQPKRGTLDPVTIGRRPPTVMIPRCDLRPQAKPSPVSDDV
jgi:hypothetical protein